MSTSSNTEILIKRSLTTDKPSSLHEGELGYSYSSNTLFIGTPDGASAIEIGHYSDLSNLTSGSYGSQTSIPVITVDGHGTVTNVYTQTISTTLDFNDGHGGTGSVNLLDGSFEFIGANGIVTTASANTLTISVDNTIVRSNTAGGNQTIDGVLNISGDLNVTGNITYTDVATIVAQNSLIKLANNNIYSDVVDIGFYGEANNGTQVVYTGLFRHAGDAGKDYYLFDNYTGTDPDANNFVINPNDPSIKISTLHANVIGGLIQGGGFLASEGGPTGVGGTGYSFQNDGGYDTGMFSASDGHVELWSNNIKILDGYLNEGLTLQYNSRLGDGSNNQVYFGNNAGLTGQSGAAIAIGAGAGQTNQGLESVALGYYAGNDSQSNFAVAVGLHAGQTSQGTASIAIGHVAGQTNQGQDAVAVGVGAGANNQSNGAVAVGMRAGYGGTSPQGQYAVAIGYLAGYDSQAAGSIALNASGYALDPANAGFYVNPIRANNDIGGNVTTYNTSTNEVVYTNVTINNNGITLANGTTITDTGTANVYIEYLQPATDTYNIAFYSPITGELTYGPLSDLAPDVLSNGIYSWSVSGTDGGLRSNTSQQIIGGTEGTITLDYWTSGYQNAMEIKNTTAGGNVLVSSTEGGSAAIRWHADSGNSYNQVKTTSDGVFVSVDGGNNGTPQFEFAANTGNFYAKTGKIIANESSDGGGGVGTVGGGFSFMNDGGFDTGMFSFADGELEFFTNNILQFTANNTQGIQLYQGLTLTNGAAVKDNSNHAIAFGLNAAIATQSSFAVALGYKAGYGNSSAQGESGIAIGHAAAFAGQGNDGIAIGTEAAYYTAQNSQAIAIGRRAGYGATSAQGQYAIAIGNYAGHDVQATSSIILNASGSTLNASDSGLYINPVRYTETQDGTYDGLMFYNQSTNEIRYSYILDGGSF